MIKGINNIISEHINKNEFELYLSILKKYKKQIKKYNKKEVLFFGFSFWNPKDLRTANVKYAANVLQPYFIDPYIGYLKFELKKKLV